MASERPERIKATFNSNNTMCSAGSECDEWTKRNSQFHRDAIEYVRADLLTAALSRAERAEKALDDVAIISKPTTKERIYTDTRERANAFEAKLDTIAAIARAARAAKE